VIIPGIFASGISGHLSTNNFTSIQTVTVGSGGSSAISFSSIPQTYTHLQLRVTGRTATASTSDSFLVTFNGDTGSSSYTNHQLYGNGSSAGANAFGGNPTSSMNLGQIAAASATSGMFGVAVIDILDYASVNKNKTVRSLTGVDLNGSGEVDLRSGSWLNNTTGITSINIVSYSASNFSQYTNFSLYGVK